MGLSWFLIGHTVFRNGKNKTYEHVYTYFIWTSLRFIKTKKKEKLNNFSEI